ncbi:UNVERIFIED_CONTAM: 2,5-diamino-6-(ribosylamino)-4(3H)-pyrimidinone 5'-phosphate reductase [Siphonaria sp. JEL0065]|nr:2,5-diamino-6-(ribosylamino)-4(3H)-pyrimidinone 5'-phosphate reductase [Siphonaria sp. JEL0065]
MDFVAPLIESDLAVHTRSDLPYVVLTFAQSLDGCIGSKDNRQPLLLSGTESMRLTHAIRQSCDAILVGSGTVANDNPRLNVRSELLFSSKQSPNSETEAINSDSTNNIVIKHPRPVVLDARLITPPNANIVLLKNNPILIASYSDSDLVMTYKRKTLEELGVSVVNVPDTRNLLSILSILKRDFGISSIMVEGGARVISSFLNSDLVDRIIITIAPLFVGDGVKAIAENTDDKTNASGNVTRRLVDPVYKQFGRDIVVAAKMN